MADRIERLRDIRLFIKRFRMEMYLILSLLLLFAGVSRNPVIEKVRFSVNAFAYPFVSALSTPVSYGKKLLDEIIALWHLREENHRLKQENEILRSWRTASYRLKEDNTYLSRLLNYSPPKEARALTARVVADSGNTYSRSILVLAGKKEGVRRGDVAMSDEGVLGRVVQVGENAARVLLLTDLSSRIPVSVGKKRVIAILEGDNTPDPFLTVLPENHQLSLGDRVTTSGHVGLYPSGLPVGVVVKVTPSEVRIRLFSDREHLEFVRLVDFGFSDILVETEEK